MDYSSIANLTEGLDRYFKEHIETGSFLRAVLENNLLLTVVRADPHSFEHLQLILFYCSEHIDRDAWGSRDAVAKWLAQRKETQS